jgi:hypothetical protein
MDVIRHANLHCMDDVGLWEVTQDTGNMLKHIESWVGMVRCKFGIGYHSVGIAERSISVVILTGVLLVRRHIITEFDFWSLALNTDMPLVIMQVTILGAICTPYCYNWFATPAFAIWTENVAISGLGAGIVFKH